MVPCSATGDSRPGINSWDSEPAHRQATSRWSPLLRIWFGVWGYPSKVVTPTIPSYTNPCCLSVVLNPVLGHQRQWQRFPTTQPTNTKHHQPTGCQPCCPGTQGSAVQLGIGSPWNVPSILQVSRLTPRGHDARWRAADELMIDHD